jgi:protein-L-isoaspartate(D-aspartate) O-methyltransferase
LEPRYTRQASRLVNTLRGKGIEDERVLEAFRAVPRHAFVERPFRRLAYLDEALPIGLGQTISQPFTVAYQTQLLETKPGDTVLEIGTGSGYQAAILCELGVNVYSVERHEELLLRARGILTETGYRIVSKVGDGTRGWQAFAPFDGIVVTAGAVRLPEPLLEQLCVPSDEKPGGRLVIPVGARDDQVMIRITREGPDDYRKERFGHFRFVPLVGSERTSKGDPTSD